jgi:hypothetical protein
MTSEYEMSETGEYELTININCEKCNTEFNEDSEYSGDDVNICKKCMKNIKNKCEVCNKKGQMNFEEFEYGVRCSSHKEDNMVNVFNKKYCEKRFIIKVEKLGGKVIGKYQGVNIKVKCICKNGHECNPIPNGVQQGEGICRICSGLDSEMSKINFIKTIIEKLEGKVIGEYVNNTTCVKCICKHGHECNPKPNSIKQGHGMCKICAKNDPELSKYNFTNKIIEYGGSVIGEYQNANSKIKCICKNNHVCYPYPSNIQQGHGMCNKCSQSAGEIFISNVLEKLNITYVTEVNNDLIKNKFRFDFYFEYNNNKYYLEFDGKQHFKSDSLFHESIDKFTQHRQKDLFKNYIARKSNIRMIRIEYLQIKGKNTEEFSIYLKALIDSNLDGYLIVNSELYNDWIFEEPSSETIEKYII